MNSYKNITSADTYLFAGESTRVLLHGIFINKTTSGTVTIATGSTAIGVIAATVIPGVYWKSEKGILIEDLQITNAAGEDITVEYSNI